VRAKSTALTEYAIRLYDERLAELGVTLSTPRDAARRGGHVTIDHPDFAAIVPELWRRGIIPDFRPPSGIRLGLSPLSTSFAEVETAVDAIRGLLVEGPATSAS
jgi:kynureninase